MFKFFLFAGFVALAAANSINYDLCPSPDGTAGTLPGPISFAIDQCPNGSPCDVAIGQDVTMHIGVYVPEPVTSMPTTATIRVGEHEFPFELPNGDACKAIATGCPEVPGNYIVTFPTTLRGVDSGTEATVTVKIASNTGRAIACGSVTTTFK